MGMSKNKSNLSFDTLHSWDYDVSDGFSLRWSTQLHMSSDDTLTIGNLMLCLCVCYITAC